MLLLFILLVIDGNQLLFHYTLLHFDQQMLLLFVLLVLDGIQFKPTDVIVVYCISCLFHLFHVI